MKLPCEILQVLLARSRAVEMHLHARHLLGQSGRGAYEGVVDVETLMNSVHELLEADRLEAMDAQHDLEEQRAAQTHAEQEGFGGEAKA